MPRHALDPDDIPPSAQYEGWLGPRFGPLLAAGWLWLARALLATVVVVIVVCRATGTTINDLPASGDGPFLPQFTMVVCLAFGISSPWVLLPYSFSAVTRREGFLLHGRTVLGPRTIDLRTARPFFWTLPTRTGLAYFVTLVGKPSGVLILGLADLSDFEPSLEGIQQRRIAPWLTDAGPLSHLRRIVMTIVVPFVLLLAFCFALIGVAVTAALGD